MGWTLDDSANNYPWRVGRKLGRTVYAQVGPVPSDDDELLGLMETEAIAESVVKAHNYATGLFPGTDSRSDSRSDPDAIGGSVREAETP